MSEEPSSSSKERVHFSATQHAQKWPEIERLFRILVCEKSQGALSFLLLFPSKECELSGFCRNPDDVWRQIAATLKEA